MSFVRVSADVYLCGLSGGRGGQNYSVKNPKFRVNLWGGLLYRDTLSPDHFCLLWAFRVAYTGNLWFVRPIDCNAKHLIFQTINVPYTQHGMFKRSWNQLVCVESCNVYCPTPKIKTAYYRNLENSLCWVCYWPKYAYWIIDNAWKNWAQKMESNLLSTLQYCGSLLVYSTVLCLLVFGTHCYSPLPCRLWPHWDILHYVWWWSWRFPRIWWSWIWWTWFWWWEEQLDRRWAWGRTFLLWFCTVTFPPPRPQSHLFQFFYFNLIIMDTLFISVWWYNINYSFTQFKLKLVRGKNTLCVCMHDDLYLNSYVG